MFRLSGCWIPCAQIFCFAPVQGEVMKPGCLSQGCQLLAKWGDRKQFSEVMLSENSVLARNLALNWPVECMYFQPEELCAYRKDCNIRYLNHSFHQDKQLCFKHNILEVWPTHFYWKLKFLVESNDKNKTNGSDVHIFHLKTWIRICFEFLTCLCFWALGI